MKPDTAEALEKSIEHWKEKLRAKIPEDVYTQSDACVLCELYLSEDMYSSCERCPVQKKTGQIGCMGSPWRKTSKAYAEWLNSPNSKKRRKKFRKAAQKEIKFLKSLREGQYMTPTSEFLQGLKVGQNMIHKHNIEVGWWESDLTVDQRVPEKLCLIHSEVSEAMEGHRKGLQDDHLPHRPMIEVELADAVIRILDLAGALELDLAGAVLEKFGYNKTRADHKKENREAEGGKRY